MNCLTMGSIMVGSNFNTRVCDLIDQFSFSQQIKDDAKRIVMDLKSSPYKPKTTALVCLYLSSNVNNFNFRDNIKETIDVFNDEFYSCKPTLDSIKFFVYSIKKKANALDVGNELELLRRMHSLENGFNSTDNNDSVLLLGSPNTEGQCGSQVIIPMTGV